MIRQYKHLKYSGLLYAINKIENEPYQKENFL